MVSGDLWMSAFRTCLGRRYLPLVVIGLVAVCFPAPVRAVVPAGTVPVTQTTPSSVPNPPAGGAQNSGGDPTPGGGHVSGGGTPTPSNPEPASLFLALTGSGAAALVALVRRRRQRSAETALR
jgi:hypothetical protein